MTHHRILIASGVDPTGGAGMVADVETCTALGVSASVLPTSLTVQNIQGVSDVTPIAGEYVTQQWEAIKGCVSISVMKIGMVPTLEVADALIAIATELQVPCVLDPLLRAGADDARLAGADVIAHVIDKIPHVIVTPNTSELAELGGGDSQQGLSRLIDDLGAKTVVVTDEKVTDFSVTLMVHDCHSNKVSPYSVERHGEVFHGTGCTFATAFAVSVARGNDMYQSAVHASDFTSKACAQGLAFGEQLLPVRYGPS